MTTNARPEFRITFKGATMEHGADVDNIIEIPSDYAPPLHTVNRCATGPATNLYGAPASLISFEVSGRPCPSG